jgi:hypothetical protein
VSLEDTLTGTRRNFDDLSTLLAFLETCMDDDPSQESSEPIDDAESG